MYEPWFYSVLGNHEQIMYDALTAIENHGPYGVMSESKLFMWTRNGGLWWFDQDYVDHPAFAEEAVGIIEDLPNFRNIIIRNKTIGLIHASGTRQWPPQKTKINTFGEETIWCRKFLSGTVPKCHGVDLVVVGHNPTDKPTKQNNTLHIDTLYKSGKLSILNLEELI